MISSGTAYREPSLSMVHWRSILLSRCTPFIPAAASVWAPAKWYDFFSASLFYRSCFTTLLPIGTYIQPLTSRAATTLYSPPTFPSFRSGGGGKSRCSWWLGRMGASACITGYERDQIIINSPPYCSPSRHSCQSSPCSEFGRAHAKCWHNG